MVDESIASNTVATQAWVSRLLKKFCQWTRQLHVGKLHSFGEVRTAKFKADESRLGRIYAKSIVLTSKNGGRVRLTVDEDGNIDIQNTPCDVFVYQGKCTAREYLYKTGDISSSFAGLTPYQTLKRFIPFAGTGDGQSDFNGQVCRELCVADGKEERVGKTLLFSIPPDKIAKRVVVLNADGEELKECPVPQESRIRQLTINLPRFFDPETSKTIQVMLPAPVQTMVEWGKHDLPARPEDIESDIFNIDPRVQYEARWDEYDGNTYYNVPLKRDFLPNDVAYQYVMVELMDKPKEDAPDEDSSMYWSDDAQQASFQVTFNSCGGSPAGVSVGRNYGETIGSFPEVSRIGHTLVGWFTLVEGGTRVFPDSIVRGDATFYAQWDVNRYMVTFDANGGDGGWSRDMDYGAEITAPTVSRDGYLFLRWEPVPVARVPDHDVEYVAQWQDVLYTATFAHNDGTGTVTTRTQKHGTPLVAPDVSRAGYAFTGWIPEVPQTMPAENVAYEAQWQESGQADDLTRVTYVDGTTWEGNIQGELGSSSIPNINNAKEVQIGSNVTSIGKSAFEYKYNLTSVAIPDSVTSIDRFAFRYCTGLISVTIGTGVTSIDAAFDACKRLLSITVSSDNNNYKSVNGLLLNKSGTTLIQGVNGEVTIPSGVISIRNWAFFGCEGLTSVTIPDGVTSIDNDAFCDCKNLTHVTIPDSVTSIGYEAFYNCSRLMSVTIGNGVTSIERRAFGGDKNITDAYFRGKTLEQVKAMQKYPWDLKESTIRAEY